MKEILVFTAGRSDFGILKNIISKIKSHKSFNLTLLHARLKESQKFLGLQKVIRNFKN